MKSPDRTRVLVLAAVVIAVLVVIAIAMGVVARLTPVRGIEASGTIEATESDLSPKVQGRLLELRVHDGDPVKKGQILAVLERRDPALNLEQARANVAAALAQVTASQAAYDLQAATYQTNLARASEGVSIARSSLGQAGENLDIEKKTAALAVDQAQAQFAAAQSTYARANTNLSRTRSLVATGDMPRQALDDATAAYATADAQMRAARDAVSLARANSSNVQIRQLGVLASRSQHRQSIATLDSARAERELVAQRRAQVLAAKGQLGQARAALALAQNQVDETDIVAPFAGYVISHNFEVGDLVAPGSAVMTIGDLAHPYVYVFVSETDLPHVKTGARADISVDGMPGRAFAGSVTEISNTAEFTPENVQTKQDRIDYLVFRVKIQLRDTTGSLKPGLPVDAVISTSPSPRP
ncbi:MAG TPA: efflux RND transporter periplasmic adaptor subunit [Candidatus Dormibacteraeota bacterium]|nr:efflux RND transporter periplasmic adaptor subunit [Candidatus Dormibacteraeota bacterium]